MAIDITKNLDDLDLNFEVINNRLATLRKMLNEKGSLTKSEDDELENIIFQVNRNRSRHYELLGSDTRAEQIIENYNRIHGGNKIGTKKPK